MWICITKYWFTLFCRKFTHFFGVLFFRPTKNDYYEVWSQVWQISALPCGIVTIIDSHTQYVCYTQANEDHLSSWSKYSQVMLAGNQTSSSQMAATISNSNPINPLWPGLTLLGFTSKFIFHVDFTRQLHYKVNRDMLLIWPSCLISHQCYCSWCWFKDISLLRNLLIVSY